MSEWLAIDLVARRYGLNPFSDEMRNLKNMPYRLGLILATDQVVKTPEMALFEYMTQHFPKFIGNLVDVHGTTLANLSGKTLRSEIPNIIKWVKPKGKDSSGPKYEKMRIPDGKGGYKEINMEI